MSHMTDEEAASFIEELLNRSGKLLDGGNIESIIEHIIEG